MGDLRDSLRHDLKKGEGLRLFPYRCTSGKLTIGYGRNLQERGITEYEADYLLSNDIDECIESMNVVLSYFYDLPDNVKLVLLNMRFNLGLNGLLKFKKTLSLIEIGNYKEAAKEMLNSKWAKQVGIRAIELSKVLSKESDK